MIVFISGCEISPQVVVVVCEDFCSSPLSLTANKDFLGLVQTTFFSGLGRVRVSIFLAQGGGSGCLAFYNGQFSAQSDIFEFQTG